MYQAEREEQRRVRPEMSMTQVICADISQLTSLEYQALYERASEERRIRADRYRRREDSLRCVAADALLRHALGTEDYVVEKHRDGKPFIRGRADFHYNLSHAGSWVVIAFGDSEVGVDVEVPRTDTHIEAIAERYFTADEQRYLLEAEKELLQRFLEIWTGKESYLKYLGTGLKKALTSFSVLSLEPELRLHHRVLPDDSCLCLCTTDTDPVFSMLDLGLL